MKKHSEKSISDKAATIWPNADITVSQSKNCVRLSVSAMYDAPGLSFHQMKELGEFFGTMNINSGSDINSSGCETCDYGSAYGFTLVIEPE